MKKNRNCRPSQVPIALQIVQPSPASPEVVLSELLDLLEEYGPAWYTEEHYRKAIAVLQRAEPHAISIS